LCSQKAVVVKLLQNIKKQVQETQNEYLLRADYLELLESTLLHLQGSGTYDIQKPGSTDTLWGPRMRKLLYAC
jgi:hypothetical protein